MVCWFGGFGVDFGVGFVMVWFVGDCVCCDLGVGWVFYGWVVGWFVFVVWVVVLFVVFRY